MKLQYIYRSRKMDIIYEGDTPTSSGAVMEEYSYTSTHPLGHTGPVTGKNFSFYEGGLYIQVYRTGHYTCSCNINSGLEDGTSCMRKFTKTDTLRQKLPSSFSRSWDGCL